MTSFAKRTAVSSMLSGSAKFVVAARFRPDGGEVAIESPTAVVAYGKRYVFDAVFPTAATQDDVYERLIAHLVHDFRDAKLDDVTVLVYGQTASGKTFTVDGLVERCCRDMDSPAEMAILEIHCEKVRDLVHNENVRLLCAVDGRLELQGLAWRRCASASAMKSLIADVKSQRSVAATSMNAKSSRAHTIVDIRHAASRHFRLVDLAGSERSAAIGATGQTLREGQLINRSLMCLRDLVRDMSRGRRGNDRGSKLTRILAPSFRGQRSKVVMLVCCSSATQNERETTSTLAFAETAKRVTMVEEEEDAVGESENEGTNTAEHEALRATVESLRDTVRTQNELLQCRAEQHERLSRELVALRTLHQLVLNLRES